MRPGSRAHSPLRRVAKRLFDIVVATTLLVMLSPVLLALVVLVRLRMGSPVIFKQERPGIGGKPFTIYKFRSMLDLTDPSGTPLPDDRRMTSFGQFIRATSADELPELWNVIKGDMSLVGPRPLRVSYLPLYNAEQARRHDVRPGITGLAQVGGRNAITWEQKFYLDNLYVDNHDLWMDMAILARTIGTVLSRSGVRESDEIDMPDFLGTATPGPGSDEPGDGG